MPSSHVWQYLHSYGEEQTGFATYSYVLVGRDKTNAQSTSLYNEVIFAIQASVIRAGAIGDNIPRNTLNIFVIPATNDNDNGPYQPDYELSRLLLTSLSVSSPLKFTRPGPYIITLYSPISDNGAGDTADLLYVDLTNAHVNAIPEIVRTYREKVVNTQLDGVEKLESLRLSLLNLALLAEDSIGFAKSAYADIRDSFLK